MSNFRINEKVVALTSGKIIPCKKGEIYEITDIKTCSCGNQMINILNWPSSKPQTQCKCGKIHANYGVKYVGSWFFRKLDTNFANEVIKNIIKKENKEPFRVLIRELTEPEPCHSEQKNQ